eukprot:9641617-Lingulodinium_polyedra.AAC.1
MTRRFKCSLRALWRAQAGGRRLSRFCALLLVLTRVFNIGGLKFCPRPCWAAQVAALASPGGGWMRAMDRPMFRA